MGAQAAASSQITFLGDLRLFSSTGGKREGGKMSGAVKETGDSKSRSQDVTSPAGFICSAPTVCVPQLPPNKAPSGHPVT